MSPFAMLLFCHSTRTICVQNSLQYFHLSHIFSFYYSFLMLYTIFFCHLLLQLHLFNMNALLLRFNFLLNGIYIYISILISNINFFVIILFRFSTFFHSRYRQQRRRTRACFIHESKITCDKVTC